MRVRVLYFGPLKQAVGIDSEEMAWEGPATVAGLLDACAARHPEVADARAHLLVAVDREFAGPGQALRGGEEVAVLPPLSGG